MNTYKLIYNPYTVETELYAQTPSGFECVGEDSALSMITKERMSKWLEPHDSWPGFFAALKEATGEKQIKMIFKGTAEDYRALLASRDAAQQKLHLQVDLEYAMDKVEQLQVSGEYKLAKIKSYIQEIKKQGDKGVLPEDMVLYMKNALDSNFEIDVTAPVSAGKSTVQNALVGRRLLPTSASEKTAVITRIEIDNGRSDFAAESLLHDGRKEVHTERVTQEFVTRLNDEKDPTDSTGERALRDLIRLKGPSMQFKDCALDLVLVDTPGGNSAMNTRNRAVMQKALESENKNMILFVFSHITIPHMDTMTALKEAAEVMKKGLNGKMSQDRFLFVCTWCDQVADEIKKTESEVRQVLSSCGIENPNLFMTSALFAELLRAREYNERMEKEGTPELKDRISRKDQERYRHCMALLSDPDCELYQYSSISQEQKKKYKEEIDRLQEMIYHSEDEMEKEGCTEEKRQEWEKKIEDAQERIALINSGIPALELVIREYLNRYAIPMKIQQVSIHVGQKAEEIDMKQKAASRWSSSVEAAKTARKSAQEQKKKLENSDKLKKDKKELDGLKLDRGGINHQKAECLKKLQSMSMPQADAGKQMKLNGKEGLWIKRSTADVYLAFLNAALEDKMHDMAKNMTNYYNKEIIESCRAILDSYKKHIAQLKEEGLFNLDGIAIEKMTDSFIFNESTVNFDEITENIREAVGLITVAKKGFWNGMLRFFDWGGYKTVPDYQKVEYVFVRDIYENQRAMAIHAFEDWVKQQTDRVDAKIKELKTQIQDKMTALDKYIKDLYEDYIKKLDDAFALEQEAEDLKRQKEWLDGFLQGMESLLKL